MHYITVESGVLYDEQKEQLIKRLTMMIEKSKTYNRGAGVHILKVESCEEVKELCDREPLVVGGKIQTDLHNCENRICSGEP